jgi:hypothetical protein
MYSHWMCHSVLVTKITNNTNPGLTLCMFPSCVLQLLKSAISGHVRTFPEGFHSYGRLLEALEELQPDPFPSKQAGQVAARLMSGEVQPEKLQEMNRRLVQSKGSADAQQKQLWMMSSCL